MQPLFAPRLVGVLIDVLARSPVQREPVPVFVNAALEQRCLSERLALRHGAERLKREKDVRVDQKRQALRRDAQTVVESARGFNQWPCFTAPGSRSVVR